MRDETIRARACDLTRLVEMTRGPEANHLARDRDWKTGGDRPPRRRGKPEHRDPACETERDAEPRKKPDRLSHAAPPSASLPPRALRRPECPRDTSSRGGTAAGDGIDRSPRATP